jgi:hypothetical protein
MDETKNCGCGHDHGDCHSEGCGCDHDHGEPVIYVTFEDEDKEVACDVLGIFEVDNIEYIALAPQDEEEVLLYRYSEDDEELKLDEIESDEEYEKVAAEFDALFFEELGEEE